MENFRFDYDLLAQFSMENSIFLVLTASNKTALTVVFHGKLIAFLVKSAPIVAVFWTIHVLDFQR
jgi:hypothetical protein